MPHVRGTASQSNRSAKKVFKPGQEVRTVKLIWFVTCGVAVFGTSLSAIAASSSYPIEVQAVVARCSAEHVVLGLKLRNAGSQKIEMYKSDLPWGIKSSLVLAVVTNTPDPE